MASPISTVNDPRNAAQQLQESLREKQAQDAAQSAREQRAEQERRATSNSNNDHTANAGQAVNQQGNADGLAASNRQQKGANSQQLFNIKLDVRG
jgi:hypothetical protein